MRHLLILLIFTLPILAHGQVASYFEKGKKHYDDREYREALYCFNKFVKTDTSVAELFKLRGNCYYEMNLPDSAEADYKRVLRMSGDFPEVYYNLSNLFATRGDFANAEAHMRTFLKNRPDDGDGLYQLSSLLKRTSADSSFYYLQRAWATDTLNQHFYNTVAWEIFERGDFARAREMARQSRVKFIYTNELLPLESYSSFALGDFQEILKIVDSLIERQSQEFAWYILKCKAEILINTPREKYSQKRFSFRLHEYSDDMAVLDRWVSDPKHPYYYGNLIQKFKSNIDSMSLVEFMMVYYGYTTDEKYSPYGHRSRANPEGNEQMSDEEKLNLYQSALTDDPFDLQTYEALASLALSMKKMEIFEDALKRYLGLIEGILATGNGESADSAYFVISTTDEYNLLRYFGMRSTQQSLRHHKGHSYDVLSAEDENGELHDIYFNIDKPFGSLSKALGASGTRSDNAKNQKIKKRRKKN